MMTILFVCKENACRSQIAEGFMNAAVGDMVKAYSAGSSPAEDVNLNAVAVMLERGIDISARKPKGFNALPVKHFDYVITMGCGDSCPGVPADRRIDWNITDPKGKDMEFFRKVRDDIEAKIAELLIKYPL